MGHTSFALRRLLRYVAFNCECLTYKEFFMAKKPRLMTDDQISKIRSLASEGMTAHAIAKKINIPPGVARYHLLKSKGRTPVAPSLTKTNNSEVEKLRARNRALLGIIVEFLKD